MKREYSLYLKDIIESINYIEKFTEDISFQDFKKDEKTASAVIRKLEIIGEASKNIPLEIKHKHPDLPWADMSKMRDKIIHSYFGVDYEIVWKTIKERLPEIKERLRSIT